MRNKEVECPKEKWLVVNYSPLDDKPEYRQPILCRAKDIGKIVYGMWIIGDKQYGKFQDDSRSDNEEKFYTAYKLVKEMFIHSNFELDKSGTPFIVKIGSPSADTITEPAWEYFVAPFTDDYSPRYEPNYAARNGMIYIKMPSGMDAKQTDDAAEEKFAGRPQIQKGDIVRFISALTGEENVEVVRCENTEVYFNPAFGEVLAIYRFDRRDFKCVWESLRYKLDRFEEAAEKVSAVIGNLRANVTSVTAAVQLMGERAKEAKEAGDDKHGSEKAD